MSSWEDEVQIDQTDLSRCLAEQPGRYGYYATVASQASHFYMEVKAEMQALEAKVEHEIRSRYRSLGEKITIKEIDAEVSMDTRVQVQRKMVRDAKLQQDLTKVAAQAFEQRLQVLIAIGAMQRAEIRGLDPVIREHSGEKVKSPWSHAFDTGAPARKTHNPWNTGAPVSRDDGIEKEKIIREKAKKSNWRDKVKS